MDAFYVHDPRKKDDLIILPQSSCSVTVDAQRLREFIGAKPDFAQWSGDACGNLRPEDFGKVVATRAADGDVCILEAELWQQRMAHYLD
ncbi:MAG: hypothetical protein WBG37_01825 [Desulfobacterales bacterium]